MRTDEYRQILKKLGKYKYALLVVLIGILLMKWPPGSGSSVVETDETAGLSRLLSSAEGVGESHVLLSGHGVVVVCEGADNAKVRLDILQAIGSYTGFGSDRITILKMSEQSRGRMSE